MNERPCGERIARDVGCKVKDETYCATFVNKAEL